MDLSYLLAQPDISEQICKNLTFEDGISLLNYLNVEELPCELPVTDRNGQINSLVLNKINAQAYPFIEREGSERFAIYAIDNDKLNWLNYLLDVGLNPNYQINSTKPLVLYAVQKGKPEAVMLLIQRGVDLYTELVFNNPLTTRRPDIVITTLLGWAALLEYDGIINKILADPEYSKDYRFPKDVNDALALAIRFEKLKSIKALLKSGVEIFQRNMEKAVRTSNFELVRVLLKHADISEMYLLYPAISEKNPEMVELLLQHGADPNEKFGGRPAALEEAIRTDQTKIIDLLHQYGANLNIQIDGTSRFTPLRYALAHNSLNAAIALVNAGVDVNQKDPDEFTLLIQAVHLGDQKLVKALLEHGADPNEKSWWYTPLSEATSPEMKELLITYGAH